MVARSNRTAWSRGRRYGGDPRCRTRHRCCLRRSWRNGRVHRSQYRSARSEYNRAETIEETAELVTHLGGTGIAAAVDHLDPDQVKTLAEQIRANHGHIDVLVNDIWGGELLKGGPAQWNTPIWKRHLDNGLRILRLAIDYDLAKVAVNRLAFSQDMSWNRMEQPRSPSRLDGFAQRSCSTISASPRRSASAASTQTPTTIARSQPDSRPRDRRL